MNRCLYYYNMNKRDAREIIWKPLAHTEKWLCILLFMWYKYLIFYFFDITNDSKWHFFFSIQGPGDKFSKRMGEEIKDP